MPNRTDETEPTVLMRQNEVDLLIINGLVITMNDDTPILCDGAISIKDGVIIDIGSSSELCKRYQAIKIIDANNKIVMPGLINTHTHAAMSLLRGLADDLPLKRWLEENIWPAEKKFMNIDAVTLGTQLAITEMLLSGTTTFNDMYFHADQVATTAKDVGMRVVVSEGVMDIPIPFRKSPEAALRNTEKLIEKWQGERLVNVAVGAHSPYNCSSELLKRQKELSVKYGIPLHIHVAETKQEVLQTLATKKHTPIGYLKSLDFLGPNVIAVHCVHLTNDDIKILADMKVGVVHNPVSNAKLECGVAPISHLVSAGIKVGVGTDGAASNSRYNLFHELSVAALFAKTFHVDSDSATIHAYDLLKMSTIDGARVLGLSDKIGSLQKGKRADIILIDSNKPNLTPMYNVFSHLVYAMNSENVDTVIVDGTVLVENRKLLTIDVCSVLSEAKRFARRVLEER